ncbi:hypothetical protein LOK49_LG13G01153 [Camellia lanceoleosa]|uniref:Uncharacterized protein n=1 Tax=Camellia lanceoleosa TaxID=1840588 RepID=A0ACC0FMT5_9ERIC|nr:hypothetical protein LOK49_LG13G01153 [Camellia lanceoleosa]
MVISEGCNGDFVSSRGCGERLGGDCRLLHLSIRFSQSVTSTSVDHMRSFSDAAGQLQECMCLAADSLLRLPLHGCRDPAASARLCSLPFHHLCSCPCRRAW